MQKIIDSHAHVFPDKIALKAVYGICDFYNFPREEGQQGSIDDYSKQSADAGVTYQVVCSTATTKEQVQSINSWIATLKSGTTKALGTLHPDFEDVGAEVERIIALGLSGIKLHPDFQRFYTDDEKAYRIYEAAEGRLPILIHAGDDRYEFSSPQRIRKILDRFPRLDIIAAHLGGYSRWEEAKNFLIGQRVWFDTSSSLWFMRNEEAVSIIRAHGSDKIMYGTDYPIVPPKKELERFNELPLTDEERKNIFFTTANRLYQFE